MGLKLCSSDGARLELGVEGYQFPADVESPLPELDLNWLVIRVEASDTGGHSWAASDPCLLSTELCDLAEWLSQISSDGDASPSINFVEPCLRMEVEGAGDRTGGESVDDMISLIVHLDCELGLPIDTQHGGVRLETPLRFTLTREELREAAGACRSLSEAFPVRSRGTVCSLKLP
ncbi:MAG TPA: hypothetical protein PLV86_08965 [Candidatus Fermentibacter daniensis]|jgi:hypothetical protein|nr:MAG: hypothetical protein AO396_06250 [Candidatus Fermentibacter daniensis]MBP7720799.1 hypothetical protein [Candidatus Fermentibacter sp.]OQC68642.1 MAG: hypothetical protein BWX47_01733 [candidate division Hyd24-12 bacterium ADurb.Bin004]KZD17132.1 MAG: hypothetical protein AO395_02365 [Candidatus Fermentibacter daniensis]KZD19554.1 MAG: hypothetical protein AO394_02080 [Candidatus Fermentibacter daniensis]